MIGLDQVISSHLLALRDREVLLSRSARLLKIVFRVACKYMMDVVGL